MQLNYELTVFLVILLVIIVAVVLVLVIGTRIEMTSANLVAGSAEPASVVGKDVYDLLLVYAREVGTQQHVEEYLVKNMNIKMPKQKSSGRLVAIIDDIVDLYNVESVNDFLAVTGIRYKHFLPKAKRCIFDDVYAYQTLESDLESVMLSMFKEHDVILKSSEIQRILHGYKLYKLTPKYAKKTIGVIKKAKAKAFEPDELALRPIVAILAKLISSDKDRRELQDIMAHLDLSPLKRYEAELLNSILRRTNPIIRLELEKERLESEKMMEHQKLQKVKTEKNQLELEKEQLEREKIRLEKEREKLAKEKELELKKEREKIESERAKELSPELETKVRKPFQAPEALVEEQSTRIPEPETKIPQSQSQQQQTQQQQTQQPTAPPLDKETIEEYPELNEEKTSEGSTTETQ